MSSIFFFFVSNLDEYSNVNILFFLSMVSIPLQPDYSALFSLGNHLSPFSLASPCNWREVYFIHGSRSECDIQMRTIRELHLLTTVIGSEMDIWVISGQWEIGLSLLLKHWDKAGVHKEENDAERGRVLRWYYLITWILLYLNLPWTFWL